MKKCKRFLACLLCAIMLMSVLPLSNVFATEYKVGDIIKFGSYPQKRVSDSELISQLDSVDGTWVSYGYMNGKGSSSSTTSSISTANPSDYMQYKDVEYNGKKYRAVMFAQYRPYYTYYKTSESYTYQKTNGYYTDKTYWFEYEPVEWRILDPVKGLVLCENIIDSQAYNNQIYSYSSKYFTDNDFHENYADFYKASTIRTWLNDDFYNCAFSEIEKAEINITTIENNAYLDDGYDSEPTSEKIFILSVEEAANEKYCFDSKTVEDTNRQAIGTDYAKCQGLRVYTSTDKDGKLCSTWLLRTADNKGTRNSYIINAKGKFDISSTSSQRYAYNTSNGIRPAMTLKSDVFGHSHSYTSKVTTQATCKAEGIITYTCSCGDSYTEAIPVTDKHTDNNNDGLCDVCGKDLGTKPTDDQPQQDNSKKPSFGEKLKAFFQRIIDWFKNLFK